MSQMGYEAKRVKMLGEEIGYGNLMEWASALWRKELADEGFPTFVAFVPKVAELSPNQKVYDELVKEIFG